MREFLRTWWMLLWRLFVITRVLSFILKPDFDQFGPIVFIALFLSIVIRVSGRRLSKTPLRDLAKWRSPFILSTSKRRQSAKPPARRPVQRPAVVQGGNYRGAPSQFEPRHLDKVAAPKSARMFGIPGAGLSGAHGMSTSNVLAGQAGETNLAKALQVSDGQTVDYARTNGLLNNFDSFWSVAMPDEKNPRMKDSQLETDIDCVLVSGDIIILLDAKFYKSGNITYRSQGDQLIRIDNNTGQLLDDPMKMTRNMAIATSRFRRLYPSYTVLPFVILMPQNSGSAIIDNVVYPGNIPLVSPEWLVSYLPTFRNIAVSPAIMGNLKNLLKTNN